MVEGELRAWGVALDAIAARLVRRLVAGRAAGSGHIVAFRADHRDVAGDVRLASARRGDRSGRRRGPQRRVLRAVYAGGLKGFRGDVMTRGRMAHLTRPLLRVHRVRERGRERSRGDRRMAAQAAAVRHLRGNRAPEVGVAGEVRPHLAERDELVREPRHEAGLTWQSMHCAVILYARLTTARRRPRGVVEERSPSTRRGGSPSPSASPRADPLARNAAFTVVGRLALPPVGVLRNAIMRTVVAEVVIMATVDTTRRTTPLSN